MQTLFVVLTLASCVVALFDDLHLPDYPVYYKDYHKQCGIRLKCSNDDQCPNICNWNRLELWAQQEALKRFKMECSSQYNPAFLIDKKEFDYNMFFTNAISPDEETGVHNTLTIDILLQQLTSHGTCAVKNLLEGQCPNITRTLSLNKCQRKSHHCDPKHPYRSYNGQCNNLRHATWGQAGNPLKLEMAPCFDDFVSKHRRSTSGRNLPNNRKLISDIQRALNDEYPNPPKFFFSVFGLIFSEFVTSDMVGRAMKRTRNATTGYRGCSACGRSPLLFRAPQTKPLPVLPEDPHYGPKNVGCLNYSPLENSNDQCDVRYACKRSLSSSYLDLSSMYGEGKYDSDGKLATSFCKTSETFSHAHVVTTQIMAVAGLFSQLHNFCVDRARSCDQGGSKENVTEKCRSLTIGVYQRIIYESLLPTLLGKKVYSKCNFSCEYDENLESSVSDVYSNALGRFQHVWMPDNFTVMNGTDRVEIPLYKFFRNRERHNCSAIMEGMFDQSVLVQRLSDFMINGFFSKDGVRGHCLMCLDLERGRDAGLCPLVMYKHYFDKLLGITPKCYESIDDLNDVFDDQVCLQMSSSMLEKLTPFFSLRLKLIKVLKKHYESPFDIDVLFLVFDKQGGTLPQTVEAATCMQFKRLKCSDRFFYTWNKFLSPALVELINSIDISTLLAMFGGVEQVPVDPWNVNSDKVSAEELRSELQSKLHLFCSL